MSTLTGKRVVNTRAVHQAAELDDLLRAHGAIPLAYPCIAIEPPVDTTALDQALAELIVDDYDWLVLTSANTVHALAERRMVTPTPDPSPARKKGRGRGDILLRAFAPSRLRTAVVGPATAEAALRELGLRTDVMPAAYRAVELAAAMPVAPGQRVLLPQSAIASPELADALRAKGALVTTVTAYRTTVGRGGVDLPALLTAGKVDAIIFASSSAVDGCAERLNREGGSMASLAGLAVVCIGPETAKVAQGHGLSSLIVPAEQTLAGVIDALELELSALSKGLAS